MTDDTLTQIREDVAYIKAKIESLPDHEERIRGLERWRWGIPGAMLGALISLLGGGGTL